MSSLSIRHLSRFKQDYVFESRTKESSHLLEKYPERVPIIIERSENSIHLTIIDKNKFLVPTELKMSQLLWVIRKRMNIKREQAVFLFSESGKLFAGTEFVSTIYENNKAIRAWKNCIKNTQDDDLINEARIHLNNLQEY